MKTVTPMLVVLALVSGCAAKAPAPEKEVEKNLAKPVDCSTAQADIKVLAGEKARTAQEIEDGASSIIPIGAVAHIFGRSEKESIEIGTGEYNRKLDDKIKEIKQQCNIQ